MTLPNQHLIAIQDGYVHFGRMAMDLSVKDAINMAVHIALVAGKDKFDEAYARAIAPDPVDPDKK